MGGGSRASTPALTKLAGDGSSIAAYIKAPAGLEYAWDQRHEQAEASIKDVDRRCRHFGGAAVVCRRTSKISTGEGSGKGAGQRGAGMGWVGLGPVRRTGVITPVGGANGSHWWAKGSDLGAQRDGGLIWSLYRHVGAGGSR